MKNTARNHHRLDSLGFDLWIRQISPMIWRRLLVRSESTLAQLHDIIQIAFGWSDSHLHRFRIHGRDYGVSRPGGPGFSQDARQVRLADFQFRRNERFLYEYDFGDSWQHEVRIERRAPGGAEAKLSDLCRWATPGTAGRLRRPLGLPANDATRSRCDVGEHLERLVESVEAGDLEAIRDQLEDDRVLAGVARPRSVRPAPGQSPSPAVCRG